MYLFLKPFACAGMMMLASALFAGCQNPLVGSWVCTLYVDGAAVTNAADEIFVFSEEGDYSWTTSQGGLERIYLGSYAADMRPLPFHVDVSISRYVENGAEIDMADATSLGIYNFEGFGRARQIYLNVAGGNVRPSADTLDKEVGPVWIGRRLKTDSPGLAEKALTLFADTPGVSFFPGGE